MLRWAAGNSPAGPALFCLLTVAPALAGASPQPRLLFADDADPIAASLYSLSSKFFAAAAAADLLEAVRRVDSRRRLLVVCDPPMCAALEAFAGSRRVELLPTSHDFSPWPRDPLLFARQANGGAVLVARPNRQAGREPDGALAAYLAGALPRDLGASLANSPLPFHGGQMLAMDGAVWLSLHSVEPRTLEILGLARVPVERFTEPRGAARYAAAARHAAGELAGFLGRRAEFVHPLPLAEDDSHAPGLFGDLAGGAGIDLDTYLTILPGASALVGDPRHGEELVARASGEELESLRAVYDLEPRGEALRAALRSAQGGPRGESLRRYLDLVAGQLSRRGLEVRRLPMLRVPTAFLADRAGVAHAEFLLGWNNVVIERPGAGKTRAEGFASGFAAGDRVARAAFAAAGVDLDLLPPLVHSIVLNGGYRCASNHLRELRDR